MQRNNKHRFTLSSVLIAIFAVIGVNAGGPLAMWNTAERIPYRWDVSQPVPNVPMIFTRGVPLW